MAFAIAEPANASGQSLKSDPLLCKRKPTLQRNFVRKKFRERAIACVNVAGLTGERHKTKRPHAFAKKWPNVFGHKTIVGKRALATTVSRFGAQIIAVIKNRHTRI